MNGSSWLTAVCFPSQPRRTRVENQGATRTIKCSLVLAALLLASEARGDEAPHMDMDKTRPIEVRVEDLLSRMTLDEKLALLHADSKFTTAAIPRLGIPKRWLSDGPHGVREDVGPDTWKPAGRTDDYVTAMPCGLALAATWNPDIAQAEGVVIGEEALARRKHIMLGPAVNIMRTPLCGRNFEYYGEDPYLAGRIAVGFIRGEQSRNVASCIKHFVANNQEAQRTTINVEMDERTLREIYLPAFEAAVREAGVWAVMGAYNKLGGQFCCQNDYLLNKILKGEWKFQGLVVSDWNAVHDTRETALSGLDLEMGTVDKPYNEFYFADPLREAVQKGDVPLAVVDDKVRRNLRVMVATGVLDGRPAGSLNTAEHQATARRVAEEAMVLLKNSGNTLPFDATKIKSLAVIGDNATRLHAHGGDSSGIKAFYEIPPLEGTVRRVGDDINVTYSIGYGKKAGSDAVEHAVAAAKAADAVVFIGGLNHDFDTEGHDRQDLKLPYGQDDLIQRVVEANPRTIVVLVAGSPVEMGPWLQQVPAVLLSGYGGMEAGTALARILFGDVNPSGKLPCTFPKRLSDSPAHALHAYPGTNGIVRYEEALLVGYRWFDTKGIEPLFPFGHGLSYTHFEYSNLRVTPSAAEFDVINAGDREGGEVAQLYIHHEHPRLSRPLKELKGFRKLTLKPGEKQHVVIPLDVRSFAYYDPDRHGWVAEPGEFTVLVGSSSRDIRLQAKLSNK